MPTVAAGSEEVVTLIRRRIDCQRQRSRGRIDALSVARTVKLLDPAALGVPEIVPPADRVNPAGSDPPAIDHAYGGDPPDAPSACE